MDTPIANADQRAAALTRARLGDVALWALFAAALLALGLWRLDARPLWWDEGWTLTVARNWLELGHYGRLREGEPVRGGLEAAPAVTLPVALTMGLLGVGPWQGRVFGVLCAVTAILLLAALAHRLYGRRTAWATAAVCLLMMPERQLHPLLQGREVLAELPMLAYLLAGYLCLWRGLAGGRWLLLPAAALLGLAWAAKGQTMPFLVASLAAPLLAALLARRRGTALSFGLVLAGAWGASIALRRAANALLIDSALPPDPISGLTGTVAAVLTPSRRLYALLTLALYGLPAIVGLLLALRTLWRERAHAAAADVAAAGWYTRLTLAAFVGTWYAWYLLLSIGWGRYLMPGLFVGAIFVAALLGRLTDDFRLGRAHSAAGTSRRRMPSSLLAMQVLLIWYLCVTVLTLAPAYLRPDRSALDVTAFLNALPADRRIETYESELLFLLERPAHFPPDQTHVDLIRRRMLGLDAPVGYNPLAADPDYLVVGAFTREYPLYADVIAAGHFRLVRDDGLYAIYARVQ